MFSGVDIGSFTDLNAIYMLRKEDNFDSFLMKHYYNEGAKRSKIEREKTLRKKARKLKVDLNNPIERNKLYIIMA